MSTGCLYLPLLLDGPMQSWGVGSRFNRRTTLMHPTKSAVVGMLAAALGIDKHAADEPAYIQRLAALEMQIFDLPRLKGDKADWQFPILRLEDYHTVQGTRLANGKIDDQCQLTHRQYLLDARFGVIMSAGCGWSLPDGRGLADVAVALANPRWGMWLGRKSCVPSSPVLCGKPGECGPFDEPNKAWSVLRSAAKWPENKELNTTASWSDGPAEGNGFSLRDLPVTFAKPNKHANRLVTARRAFED